MPYILTIKLRDFGRGCVNDIGTRQRNKMVYPQVIYFRLENILHINTRILNNIKIICAENKVNVIMINILLYV